MKYFFFFLLLNLPHFAWAEAAKGRVRTDGAVVYQSASFDSPVIANLAPGSVYYISDKLFNGAFYRILVKKSVLGYVPDYQIDHLSSGSTAKNEETKNKKSNVAKQEAKKEKRRDPPKRPLSLTRYGGLEFGMLDFKESTMGSSYHENISFYGFKFSGPDLFVAGPFTMDFNLLMHFGAPDYYQTATGNSADGFILLADVMFETNWPLSQNAMLYYGFGPMFHFSKFNLALGASPNTKTYLAEDMNFGAVFNLGIAGRLSSRWGVRGEARYYWEKTTYLGFAGAVQYAF